MAKDPKPEQETASTPFENEASSLDEMTHKELCLMHRESSEAILFAKNIQWRSVGSSLLVFGACIAIDAATPSDKSFSTLLSAVTILLTCGVIFVLLMYQFWQINEISRIREIEKNYSSLYAKINGLKSKREGNAHRYTLLMFMVSVVILGAVVANFAFKLIK